MMFHHPSRPPSALDCLWAGLHRIPLVVGRSCPPPCPLPHGRQEGWALSSAAPFFSQVIITPLWAAQEIPTSSPKRLSE